MDVEIQGERLPGIGHRYQFAVDGDRQLFIIVRTGGRRDVGVIAPGRDEPDLLVSLTQQEAVMVAAVLTGARFCTDDTDV